MLKGGWFTVNGSCPGCGCDVRRSHGWIGGQIEERYDCTLCGTYQYGRDATVPPAWQSQGMNAHATASTPVSAGGAGTGLDIAWVR